MIDDFFSFFVFFWYIFLGLAFKENMKEKKRQFFSKNQYVYSEKKTMTIRKSTI
jgi:hypothetical protein